MVAVAIGGSALIGGVSSYMGAKAQNKAANRQLAANTTEIQQARNRQGLDMFGMEDWTNYRAGTEGRNPDQDAAGAFFSKYGSQYNNIKNAGNQLVSDTERNVAGVHRDSANLDTLARGSEDAIAAFGTQGADRIRRDTAHGLAAANQNAVASTAGLGMNTLTANQQGQNAARFNMNQSDALTNLEGDRLNMFLGARANRINTNSSRYAANESANQGLAQTRYATARAPGDAVSNLFQQPAFNAQQIGQGGNQSPWGNAGASVANSLGQWGSMAMFANNPAQQPAQRPQTPGVYQPNNWAGGNLPPPNQLPNPYAPRYA